MMPPQLCDKSELEALLLAFGSTIGTYLLAKDELLTPSYHKVVAASWFGPNPPLELQLGATKGISSILRGFARKMLYLSRQEEFGALLGQDTSYFERYKSIEIELKYVLTL